MHTNMKWNSELWILESAYELLSENCIVHETVSEVKFLCRLQVASKFMPVSSLIIGECDVQL